MKNWLNAFFLIVSLALVTSMALAQFDDLEEKIGAEGEPPKAGPTPEVSNFDYANLSKALKGGQENEVVQAASRILSRDSNDLKALNALVVYYINTNREGLARIILERALRAHPEVPALYNNLGVIELKQGDMRKAIAAFRKAMELNGNYRVAATNLSSIFLEYRDHSRAIAPLEEGYEAVRGALKKGDKAAVQVANNYAVALAGVGEAKKARDVYKAILDGDPRNPEVLLNYAILLVEVLNEKKEASKVLSKLKFITDKQSILRRVEKLEKQAEKES